MTGPVVCAKKPGEPASLGDNVGYALDESVLYGRIVGLIRGKPMLDRPFIVREFTEEDIEAGRYYPTGKIARPLWPQPWQGPHLKFHNDTMKFR